MTDLTDREKKIEELHKHIKECILSLGEEYDANYIVSIHTPYNDKMQKSTNMVRGNILQLAMNLLDLCKLDNNVIPVLNAVIEYLRIKEHKEE